MQTHTLSKYTRSYIQGSQNKHRPTKHPRKGGSERTSGVLGKESGDGKEANVRFGSGNKKGGAKEWEKGRF